MAGKTKSESAKKGKARSAAKKPKVKEVEKTPLLRRLWRGLWRWVPRIALGFCAVVFAFILLFSVVNPPFTLTIWSEARAHGGTVERQWVRIEDASMVAARSVVAAEDANFCLHWGFDAQAIRSAIEEGATRGASSISQQVVKNVFLWQGRSWPRKAAETLMTPLVELVWSKQRILEVYLNVAEMGDGVFGIEAAAQHHFGVSAAELNAVQAARIAAILPAPKTRNPAEPSPWLRQRAASIRDGAATIAADGRAACFED